MQYREPIDPCAGGHDYSGVVTDPTCTEGGYTTYTCTRCDDEYVDDETDALGHDYAGVVTLKPTYRSDGNETFTCKNCGDAYTVVLPKLSAISMTTDADSIISITEAPKGWWVVVFIVTVTCDDGSTEDVEYTVTIPKNGDGTIDMGDSILVYDIKGNGSNVKVFRIEMK